MPSIPRALAVDFGASAIRVLEVGPGPKGGLAVLGMAQEDISWDPGKTPELLPLYTQALKAGLSRLGTQTKIGHLCLGGPSVFVRLLKIPVLDPTKINSMVNFEAQQTIPAIEQASWAHQILPSSQPGEADVLLLAMKSEAVQEMVAASASVGLKIQSVTLTPAALINAFAYNYPEVSDCSVLIEIGVRSSTIILMEGQRYFIRIVSIGGAAITQSIATDLQENFSGAEVLKLAKGFVHPGGAYEDSADAATARISKLARGVMSRLHTEVERTITYFRSQQGGGKPVQAWLAGGGSLLGYTDLFFQEKLKIPVKIFQPFRRLSVAGALPRHLPAWSAAVGASMQVLPETPLRINVLAGAGLAQAQKDKDRPALIFAAVALIALIFLPGIHGFWQAHKGGSRLELESQKVEEASKALELLNSNNALFLQTSQDIEKIMALENERLRWPRLLEELRKKAPAGLWITGLKVIPPNETPAGTAPLASATNSSRPPALEIGGMFETKSEQKDAEAVEIFLKTLSEGKILENITVTERETPSYRDGKTDQVALRFQLKADWPWRIEGEKSGVPPASAR